MLQMEMNAWGTKQAGDILFLLRRTPTPLHAFCWHTNKTSPACELSSLRHSFDMHHFDSEEFDDFLGEEVVDPNRVPMGTLACYWEHEDGQPVLLGIDIGELSETTHIAPVKGVILDSRKSYVVLNFTKEKIRGAPSLGCACELDASFEKKVFAYYGANALGFQAIGTEPVRELRKKFAPEPVAKPVDSTPIV